MSIRSSENIELKRRLQGPRLSKKFSFHVKLSVAAQVSTTESEEACRRTDGLDALVLPNRLNGIVLGLLILRSSHQGGILLLLLLLLLLPKRFSLLLRSLRRLLSCLSKLLISLLLEHLPLKSLRLALALLTEGRNQLYNG